MSDLISREDLYHDMTMKRLELHEKGLSWNEFCRGFGFAMEFVKQAPSAEPERKKGEWIPHPEDREWDVCSVCGTGCKRREYEIQSNKVKLITEFGYEYCPRCGAKMD